MKKFVAIAMVAMSVGSVAAQDYEADAVKMMRQDLGGTARALGVGGAYSTVGADMSSITSNPAGIALYRSHEFALTTGAQFGATDTRYAPTGTIGGQQTKQDFVKGSVSQIGIVFASKKLSRYNNLSFDKGGSKLDRVVVAIGFQKIVDFSRNDLFSGTNAQSSYAQALANESNTQYAKGAAFTDISQISIPAVQAFQTYATDYTDTFYNHLAPKIAQPVRQVGNVATQGSLSDINFTLGFNIANTVYIGAGLGVPYMNYNRYGTFTESNLHGDSTYTSSFSTSLTGLGVNGRFGIIVKPVQWLRLGASVQTPTYFRLDENTYGHTYSSFGANYYQADTGSVYRFNYTNPLKATFGASFYILNWAFISVDYELNDYTHTHFAFDGYQADADYWNNLIAAKYKLASTVKAGAEFSYKTLRVRAGFAWMESPFRNSIAVNGYGGERFNYTAGIGYRGKRFFADLAYVRTEYKDYYTPYSYKDASNTTQEPGVFNSFHGNTIMLTLGVKFGMNRN